MEQLRKKYEEWAFPFIIVASSSALFFASLYSFLLFHTVVELFTVVITFGIFAIAWSSRRYISNIFLLIIGISYLFVGGLDLIHMLTYKGLDLIKGYGTNLPTQLWIAARYLESASFVAALLMLKDEYKSEPDAYRKKAYWIFLAYLALFLAILVSIFVFNNFPAAYPENSGLTNFKIYSEYIISLFFLGSVVLIFRKGKMFDREMSNLLSLALIIKIFSELAFTEYIGVYDFANILGHILRVISALLLYRAVLDSGLMKPYQSWFLNLKKSEDRYRSLVEFSPDPIVVNSFGKIVYANGPARKLFGAESGEMLVGAKLTNFFNPIYREQIRIRIKKIFTGELKETPVTEMEVLRPDGRRVPVEVKGMKITYEGKMAVESIIRDISERKAAEEKIRSLAKFPEENPSPVMRVLAEGTVQYLNPPARKMLVSFGWHEKKPLPGPLLSAVQRVLEKGVKYEFELVCPSKFVFSVMLSPSKTEGWVNVYAREITEKKLAEKKLARTRAELQKRIQEQLAESYKHLGLVNRKISMLLEMEKHSQSKKDKQGIVDYIARSALGLAHAKVAFLYIAVGKNHFNLISSDGIEKEHLKHVQIISSRPGDFISNLMKTKSRVNGLNGSLDYGNFNEGFGFSYSVVLPVLSGDICKGFLFLGFTDRSTMDSQEFEFLDVFSRQVSSALDNSGILK